MFKKFFHQFASPKTFYFVSQKIFPYLFWLSIAFLIIGLIWGILYAPVDKVQGNSYRIIYMHVPASFAAQSLYMMIAIASFIFLIWKVKLAAYVVKSVSLIGASVTFLALISGSIWGVPTWGTWWQWDARITSTLILFIMYLGLISLHNSFNNLDKADKFISVLALVGFINIPIIKMSVNWWSTLHQPASITLSSKPSIDLAMLYPLMICIFSFLGLIIAIVLRAIQYEILLREKNKKWIQSI